MKSVGGIDGDELGVLGGEEVDATESTGEGDGGDDALGVIDGDAFDFGGRVLLPIGRDKEGEATLGIGETAVVFGHDDDLGEAGMILLEEGHESAVGILERGGGLGEAALALPGVVVKVFKGSVKRGHRMDFFLVIKKEKKRKENADDAIDKCEGRE